MSYRKIITVGLEETQLVVRTDGPTIYVEAGEGSLVRMILRLDEEEVRSLCEALQNALVVSTLVRTERCSQCHHEIGNAPGTFECKRGDCPLGGV